MPSPFFSSIPYLYFNWSLYRFYICFCVGGGGGVTTPVTVILEYCDWGTKRAALYHYIVYRRWNVIFNACKITIIFHSVLYILHSKKKCWPSVRISATIHYIEKILDPNVRVRVQTCRPTGHVRLLYCLTIPRAQFFYENAFKGISVVLIDNENNLSLITSDVKKDLIMFWFDIYYIL